MPGTGLSGTWTLDTTGMEDSGYDVRIHGMDRTIINSNAIGHRSSDIEGFCLA